jgi:putative N6-adenine-specific DNA methylase
MSASARAFVPERTCPGLPNGSCILRRRPLLIPARLRSTLSRQAMRYDLLATATFGLESLVGDELAGLGFAQRTVENGQVRFAGDAVDLARCSLGLRIADRIFVVLAEFPAADFDALFEGVRGIDWRGLAPRDAAIVVNARSVKSRLASVPAIQSVAKKAIVASLTGSRQGARLGETGPTVDVEIRLVADRAAVMLDATGEGLHRRGYRTAAGEAPLRENLAAAIVLLSRWQPGRPFADPLCGSGTIAIEAALIGRGRAPGASRSFAAESWPFLPRAAWTRAREEARAAERLGEPMDIAASDRDGKVLELARANAARAGVADAIRFDRRDVEAFAPSGDYGCIVTNPPYGERLGDVREAEHVSQALGRLYRRLGTWSLFALSPHPEFPRHFGARSTKNRKLYNGSIRCWLYQYFGPLPPWVAGTQGQLPPREA